MTWKFGALPPASSSWETGKTAASIAWVKYLESRLASTGDPLYAVILALKSGDLVANAHPPQE